MVNRQYNVITCITSNKVNTSKFLHECLCIFYFVLYLIVLSRSLCMSVHKFLVYTSIFLAIKLILIFV